jgi:predicted dehydrogenase
VDSNTRPADREAEPWDGSRRRLASRPVRVGLIGTSWWSALALAPALAAHPRAEIAAVCGRNAERTRDFAQEFVGPASPDFSDGLEAQRVVDAASRAAAGGRWERL